MSSGNVLGAHLNVASLAIAGQPYANPGVSSLTSIANTTSASSPAGANLKVGTATGTSTISFNLPAGSTADTAGIIPYRSSSLSVLASDATATSAGVSAPLTYAPATNGGTLVCSRVNPVNQSVISVALSAAGWVANGQVGATGVYSYTFTGGAGTIFNGLSATSRVMAQINTCANADLTKPIVACKAGVNSVTVYVNGVVTDASYIPTITVLSW